MVDILADDIYKYAFLKKHVWYFDSKFTVIRSYGGN